MTQPTLTPAEIETLRENVRKAENVSASLALIDRLTAPAEPEVDEATKVWREMEARGKEADGQSMIASEYRRGIWDGSPGSIASIKISYLREFIASKDAEIAEWKLASEEARSHWDSAVHEWNKAESELAALRAENERLNGLKPFVQLLERFRVARISGDGWRMTFDFLSREELEKAEAAWIDLHKAAERNTAESATDTAPGHTDLMVSPESIDAFLEANPPVIVTQADRDAAADLKIAMGWSKTNPVIEITRKGLRDDKPPVLAFARHRTEAEARGRREALDAIERLIRADRTGKEPPHER